MEWELIEILTEVKRVCYQNIRTVERLVYFNSLAQKAALKLVEEQREQGGYLFTLQELAALHTFQLLRTELIKLSRTGGADSKREFYLLRRRLIENIESLIKRETATERETASLIPHKAAQTAFLPAVLAAF